MASLGITRDDVTVLTILVDSGERSSGVPARLRSSGIDVEYRDLTVGDYVVGVCAVERKSVDDLHRSIENGRLWRQIGALRSAFDVRYPLVEGCSLSRPRISNAGMRGALLAVVDSEVRLVWSRSRADSAGWLQAIFRRESQRRRRSRPWSRRAGVERPAAFLALVPGITPPIAADLIRRFGSIAAIAAADESELLTIRGLGAARVAILKRILA
jgi:ERCC4-type nuclease